MAPLKKACWCINLGVATELLGWFGILFGALHTLNTQTKYYQHITSYYNDDATFVGNLIQIIVCALLIAGAKSKNNNLLLPWLTLNMIGLILINLAYLEKIVPLKNPVGDTLILLFIDLVCGYFWMIVLSLYKEMDQGCPRVILINNLANNC